MPEEPTLMDARHDLFSDPPKRREHIEERITGLLIDFGPDRHADGSEEITNYIMKLLMETEEAMW